MLSAMSHDIIVEGCFLSFWNPSNYLLMLCRLKYKLLRTVGRLHYICLLHLLHQHYNLFRSMIYFIFKQKK